MLDGFGHPEEYLERANEIGLKGFAVTEHGNQYSWCYFDKLKSKYPNLLMIYGVELYECNTIQEENKDSKYFHLVALAKNEKGRIALNEIVTKSNFEGFYYKPRVDLNMLRPHGNDLIILSGCLASKIAREDDYTKCVEYINEYKSIFPHFYLEMQSHETDDQEQYNKKILRLSEQTNTPFTITTDSHVAKKEDLEYQGRHVQIARDNDTMSEIYSGCYMQSKHEIHNIMDSQIGREYVEKGLDESNRIADLIEVVNMPFQEPQLPTYPLPDGFNSNHNYLVYLTQMGWHKRCLDSLPKEERDKRKQRLEYELEVINNMNYSGYFLIVWDFVQYAKTNNHIVGDGRGSGGGSIVNYLLEISELDPIEYDLIFERFLNPERVSMPSLLGI
jgi:DNA polymerase-3 subunit alpha